MDNSSSEHSHQETFEPTRPPSSKPPFKTKAILITGIVLTLIVADLTTYLFVTKTKNTHRPPMPTISQPSPTPPPAGGPTVNWKTYIATESGYLFKYPSDWIIRKAGKTITILPTSKTLAITIFPLPPQVADELIETDSSKIVTKKNIKISGVDAIEATVTFKASVPITGGKTTIIVFVNHNNEKLQIQLTDIRYKDFFDQILSTFKFLE